MVSQNKSRCVEYYWLYHTCMVGSYVRFYAKTYFVGTILFVPKPKFILTLIAWLSVFSVYSSSVRTLQFARKTNVYLFFYSVVTFTSAIHKRIRSIRKDVLIHNLNIVLYVQIVINVIFFLVTGYGARIYFAIYICFFTRIQGVRSSHFTKVKIKTLQQH